MKLLLLIFFATFVLQLSFSLPLNLAKQNGSYEPTWDSLGSRPLPEWYDEAKIGIFLHWGVYSVPSYDSEWIWNLWKTKNVSSVIDYLKKRYPPNFTYQEFAKEFTAEFFDPYEWAELFQKSGAKYVVLTSKHHEGYTLWPSTYSFSWNSVDIGPGRDLIGALADAIREKTDLHFGLYYSLIEWYNPMYLLDKNSNFTENIYVPSKLIPELVELITKYRPDVLWADGDWAPEDYLFSKEFLAWLYNESPVKESIVTNDRWGNGVACHHGGFLTCHDNYNPGVLLPYKWERAMPIERYSWGFTRHTKLNDYLTTHQLLKAIVTTISTGGNILINVGPTKDGIIVPIFQERLLDMGAWLAINGEAIYGSTPWTIQNDTIGETWYTSKNSAVYAITLNWPVGNVLKLRSPMELFQNSVTTVRLLGNSDILKWALHEDVEITLPDKATVTSQWAWVIKINTN